MTKRHYLKINVSKQEFKKIKKGKQTIIVRLNNEETNKIRSKDRIVIQGRIDRFRKKVKETHVYSTLEELTNNIEKKQLGYKKKDTPNYDDLIKDYSNEDIKKYGLLVIKLKKKKHIFRKIMLAILVVVILFLSVSFISNKLDEIKIKKFNNNINELAKERTDYVFVEINPSFVLTIKDNKVSDVACLNDDCIEIYNDIDVKGKNINDSIDNLYNTSKEKGFDTSNGVKVKTSSNVSIETKDYITVEYIDTAKEKELLKEVKNNEAIKNVSNDDYYSKLWSELKKDSDYGEVYTCRMNDEKILQCFFTEDFLNFTNIIKGWEYDKILSNVSPFIEFSKSMKRVLDKFGIRYFTESMFGDVIDVGETGVDGIYINGKVYDLWEYTSGSKTYNNVLIYEVYDENIDVILIPLTKLDLLTLQYDKKEEIIMWAYYEKDYVTGCQELERIGLNKQLCENDDNNTFFLCDITESTFPEEKDCKSITKQVYNNIINLNTTCSISSGNFVEERELECPKNETTLERCNIDKNNFTKIDCTTNFDVKLDEETKKKMEYRNKLLSQGYILNVEGTKEKCPLNSVQGTCEYLCLYPKDSEGYYNTESEPISCELLIFGD